MIELNTIYNEDCMEGMKRIPDGSVDCIICDLPYGTTANKWDEIIPLESLWNQYNRIIKKNGAILLFGQRKFSAKLIMSAINIYRYDIVWVKSRAAGFLQANLMPLRSHEQIMVFYKRLPTYNPQFSEGKPYERKNRGIRPNYSPRKSLDTYNNGRRYPKDVVEFQHDKTSYHPTQKPVALIEYLIKTYSNEGDTILDNCMGSGTTAIACMNTKRNFIGFEKEKKYFDIAMQRITQMRQQPKLDL